MDLLLIQLTIKPLNYFRGKELTLLQRIEKSVMERLSPLHLTSSGYKDLIFEVGNSA